VDAALQEARTRRTAHEIKTAGGAVVAASLLAYGRFAAPAAGDTAAVERTIASRLRRRAFLRRLAYRTALLGATPYALAHGWLGVDVVPDELRELAAVRATIQRQLGASRA
jgi:hypothetical protein